MINWMFLVPSLALSSYPEKSLIPFSFYLLGQWLARPLTRYLSQALLLGRLRNEKELFLVALSLIRYFIGTGGVLNAVSPLLFKALVKEAGNFEMIILQVRNHGGIRQAGNHPGSRPRDTSKYRYSHMPTA